MQIDLNGHDGEDWDTFVRGGAEGSFCHLAGWSHVVRDTMGHEPLYFAARDRSGALVGVLPLVRVRSRLFRDRLVSMPFLNYGGPLGTPGVKAKLVAEAVRLAEGRGIDTVELRTRYTSAADLPSASPKLTVVLELPSDPEVLWASLKAKLRSQVRKPQKEGLEFRSGKDQLGPFHAVLQRNMRDLGTPVLPYRFFERIAATFEDEVVFAAVYHEGRPVAAGAGFAFNGEFEITWASALREYNRFAPNMLLYWGLMEESIRRELRSFNFGRCSPGEGTHRFKQQWGGLDEPLPWSYWPAAPEAGDEPGRVARAASAGWQHLPLPIANALGPVVARQLPWW